MENLYPHAFSQRPIVCYRGFVSHLVELAEGAREPKASLTMHETCRSVAPALQDIVLFSVEGKASLEISMSEA